MTTTENIPFCVSSLYSFWNIPHAPTDKMSHRLETALPAEVLFISSFPPRECGIASYTQDLIVALQDQYVNGFESVVCALESNADKPIYHHLPKYILNTDNPDSYSENVQKINECNEIKLVVIQHEFGLFAATESEFRAFYQLIQKPIIFVFHTVLPSPNPFMIMQVQDMATNAASIIVMTTSAKHILIQEYQIKARKIKVIPHGTHLVSSLDVDIQKKRLSLDGRQVLSTFGLISSIKSIETTLYAIPTIAEHFPDVLFLVLGKTHPSIVKKEGEKYRAFLENIVSEMRIEKHVRFVNEYLPIQDLLEYLQLTDIYLFTSKDPNQAVSGTFSYAVSSGCPVISTPIPHAREVLNDQNGITIDFEDSEQLASAVISLLADEKRRNEISNASLQKMASTAWPNSAIAHAQHFKKMMGDTSSLQYRLPEINLKHFKKMTNAVGMIQFAKIAVPDIRTGYTLDDNARAMIAACQCYESTKNPNYYGLIKTYLNFIQQCIQPNGTFLNYVDVQLNFTSQNDNENLEDSNGRAIWALGYLISIRHILPSDFSDLAEDLIEQAMPGLDRIHSTRAMSFIIKGLHFQNKKENIFLLQILANRLVQMFRHEKSDDWHWFENYLTYGNSSLPEALLCAYLRTHDVTYKNTAIMSFDFLLSKIFVDGEIRVVSNNGWLIKNSEVINAAGGEQPIDVAYTILALEKFFLTFKKNEYKTKAISAFNWFLGANHLRQIMYNSSTGGCYDGLEEHNVNLNQGAESTVSYILARLSIARILELNTTPSMAAPIQYAKQLQV